MDTHTQVRAGGMPDTAGLNFFTADPNLAFILQRLATSDDYHRALPYLHELGQLAGSELDELARVAERHPPQLRAFNQRGERIDEVIYHPAYREMERIAFERFGLAAMSHRPGVLGWPTPVPHLVKYALKYLFVQAEFGLMCPVSVTDSTSRMIRLFGSPAQRATYLPRLTATRLADLWQGTMFLTERDGGSDLGVTATIARRDGDGWRIYGFKWFCSNVSADVILLLARPEGAPPGTRGLGMFLVPKRLPDGTRNAYRIERLKDKLGTRDMATGEVTFDGAWAEPVGPLDAGFRQMAEMINVSRLSNALRAAALMRRAFLEALVYTQGRYAFGKPLSALPLVRENLFDMLLDVESCAALVFHGAALLDRADAGDTTARRLARIITPLSKFYVTKRARWVTGEALELRGGNGYIEEWINPRLLRDSHLGSIWEGTTNIVALDVLRAILRDEAGAALLDDLRGRLAALRDAPTRHVAAWLAPAIEATATFLAQLPERAAAEREAVMLRLAEQLAHLTMTTLLLEEAEALADATGSYRKLLVATAYARRALWPASRLLTHGAAQAWLDALVTWQSIPAQAALDILPAQGMTNVDA
jgi:alkylation response protein AidB-like acyl-CoA dehydrogenase